MPDDPTSSQTPAVTTMDPNKPGSKTSEFWLSMIVTVLGIVITAYGIFKDKESLVIFGSSLSGGVTSIYTGGRSLVKKAANS